MKWMHSLVLIYILRTMPWKRFEKDLIEWFNKTVERHSRTSRIKEHETLRETKWRAAAREQEKIPNETQNEIFQFKFSNFFPSSLCSLFSSTLLRSPFFGCFLEKSHIRSTILMLTWFALNVLCCCCCLRHRHRAYLSIKCLDSANSQTHTF